MAVPLVLTILLYSNNSLVPTEDKTRADIPVEIKLKANEYTKNPIKLAHNAFESYEFELNQIESAKII